MFDGLNVSLRFFRFLIIGAFLFGFSASARIEKHSESKQWIGSIKIFVDPETGYSLNRVRGSLLVDLHNQASFVDIQAQGARKISYKVTEVSPLRKTIVIKMAESKGSSIDFFDQRDLQGSFIKIDFFLRSFFEKKSLLTKEAISAKQASHALERIGISVGLEENQKSNPIESEILLPKEGKLLSFEDFLNHQKEQQEVKDDEFILRDRAPASLRQVLEHPGCDPIDFSNNKYIKFNSLHPRFSLEKVLKKDFPDFGYSYPSPDKKAEEDKEFLLIKKLYEENKVGQVLKGVQFFREKFGVTPFDDDLELMISSSKFKIAKRTKTKAFKLDSIGSLKNLYKKTKKNELRYQIQEFLVYYFFLKKDLLEELSVLLDSLKDHHPKQQLFELEKAVVYRELNQINESRDALNGILLNENHLYYGEASYRIGEIFMVRGDYSVAHNFYLKAYQKKKDSLNNYPFAVLNHCEVLIQLGRLKEARELYQDYLERYPYDENRWSASYRLAELDQGIVDKKKSTESYIDIINAYPATLGALLSQLRLAECDRGDPIKSKNRLRQISQGKHLKAYLMHPSINRINERELNAWIEQYLLELLPSQKQYQEAVNLAVKYRSFQNNNDYIVLIKDKIGSIFEYHLLKRLEKARTEKSYKSAYHFLSNFSDYLYRGFDDHRSSVKAFILYRMRKYQLASNYLKRVKESENLKKPYEYYRDFVKAQFLFKEDPGSLESLGLFKKLLSYQVLSSEVEKSLLTNLKFIKENNLRKKLLKETLEDPRISKGAYSEVLAMYSETLFSLKEYESLINETETALLTRNGLLSSEHLFKIRYFRFKSMYNLSRYTSSVEEAKIALLLDGQDRQKLELRFMEGQCFLALKKRQEAIDTFRKIASEDGGDFKNAAKLELKQLE